MDISNCYDITLKIKIKNNIKQMNMRQPLQKLNDKITNISVEYDKLSTDSQ